MALDNKERVVENGAAAVRVAPNANNAQRKNNKASAELYAKGNEVIASMPKERQEALGSKSHTLHFVHLLGLASQKGTRKTPEGTVDCSNAVGVVLKTDETIKVPVIDPLKDKNTGIDPAKDISYRTVKAGETFALNYYEFMFLIIRDEYAGLFEANGRPDGAYFSTKMTAFYEKKTKLPTPTINFRDGQIKSQIVDMDEKAADGSWVMKPQYEEQFGALLKKKSAPRRASGDKKGQPQPRVVAMALQKILGVAQ